ncbi:MAG TPA: hypothetical protein VFW22_15250, partial [Pseudolabrys sp.]|nr:hypothetical protein [Pseudolabrys sp.]
MEDVVHQPLLLVLADFAISEKCHFPTSPSDVKVASGFDLPDFQRASLPCWSRGGQGNGGVAMRTRSVIFALIVNATVAAQAADAPRQH